MPTCPRGHDSIATDYCDECGSPIGGPAPATGGTGTPAGGSGPAPDPGPGGSGEPCPDCGTPKAGRFCEVCGRDFLATPAGPADAAGRPDGAGLAGAGSPGPGSGGPGASGPATGGTGNGTGPVTGSGAGPIGGPHAATPEPSPAGGADGLPASGAPGGTGWSLVVTADRDHHARMQAAAAADAPQVAFPAFYPQRRFALGPDQVLIGRRSRSRGIEPQVDLTGPPEDAGVSHTHALLVPTPAGWSVVDLDSANGTYLNESPDPIAANTPVPLADGDRVHVGAWTTLTLRHEG